MDELRFDYKVAEEVAKRLATFFEGLPEEGVRAALEELIDDYTGATFGVTVMNELRKVKLPGNGQCITTQTLAKGRAVLISAYGFKVINQTECGKCKGYFLSLDENSKGDFQRERATIG